MKKIALVTLTIAILMLSAPFVVKASASQPDTINSAMLEPVSSITTENGVVHLVFHTIYYSLGYEQYQGHNYLITYDCYYSESASVFIYLRGASYHGIAINNNTSTVNTSVYDIASGSLLTSNNSISPLGPFNEYGDTYYYYTGLGFYTPNQNDVAYYSYIPSGLTVYDSANKMQPWVTWASEPIIQTYVRSVLPEPVQDEYNRYIVVTGENVSLLFWLNLHIAGVDQIEQTTQNTYDHYDYRQSKYFAPTFLKTDSGYELRLQMDPLLRVYLNGLGYTGMISCQWQLTEYNLVTGEFIQSLGNTIDDFTPDIYYQLIQSFTIENAVGISVYGVNYTDSSDEHLHRAAVIYSVDPSFEQWKSQVLTWLERIYGSMSQEGETVTIADDPSAFDEMQSAADDLEVTDVNGEPVDPAAQVEVAFSEAASGIGSIGGGISSVNGMMADLFQINPIVIVPLVVALALGLIVTIIGKDKSD